MAAKPKEHPTHPAAAPQAGDSPAASVRPGLGEVRGDEYEGAADSPARSLQAHLETSLVAPSTKARILDIGRILASASGITLILGVFVFSGIW